MFSNEEIKKILDLSDDDLRDKISVVMSATGKNSKISDRELNNIRNAVSNLSEQDIKNLLSNIPTEKLNHMKDKMVNEN